MSRASDLVDEHVFQPDEKGDRDWQGELMSCLTCTFPRANAVHITHEQMIAALKPRHEGDVSDRIVGDRERDPQIINEGAERA